MLKQYSVQKLDEAFDAFYKLGWIQGVDNYGPHLTKSPYKQGRRLTIKGRYPTKPSQVFFEFKYVYEGLGWKLVAISVNIK